MSADEIDEYLTGLEPDKRDALQRLRERILIRIPDAEQCISYGMPGFRVGKTVLVGFAAFKNHLSWFPHSGRVLPELAHNPATAPLLEGYDWNDGTLRFPVGHELADELVDALIETKLQQSS